MIRYPSPDAAFPMSSSEFGSFTSLYPEILEWQTTLQTLLVSMPKMGVSGRSVGASLLSGVRKLLSYYQQNSLSFSGISVWEYLWPLKRATYNAHIAYALGASSPNAPTGEGVSTITLSSTAATSLQALQEWSPGAPVNYQSNPPPGLSFMLSVIAEGASVAPETAASQNAGGAFTVHIVQPQDTLRSLAAQYLGDPSLWTKIRDLNMLRYPYISPYLQDRMGPPQEEWILQTVQVGTSASLLWAPPVSAGQTVLTLPGPQISPGDVIVLSQGGSFVQEYGVAASVSGSTVTLQSAVQNDYPPGSRAYLCSPIGDEYYTVVNYGDPLKIPATSQSPSATQVLSPSLILGTDIAVGAQGNLALTSFGDVATTSGIANLQQAVQNRIRTEAGSMPLWPSYGSNLQRMISLGVGAYQLVAADLQAVLLQDPRIASVQNPVVSTAPSGSSQILTFTATITIQGFENSSVGVSVPLS